VARDGYVLKGMTDSLAKAVGLKIETQYLYGSRQAWHVPAITDLSDESLSWLFEKTRTLTPRIILGRLQIVPEQISEIMTAVKWPQESWDRQLTDGLLNEFRADLLGSREFLGVVARRVAASRRSHCDTCNRKVFLTESIGRLLISAGMVVFSVIGDIAPNEAKSEYARALFRPIFDSRHCRT
jgi:hypothetical protein